MKTFCKDCVFAEYTGLTQHGCYIDMLDKFRQLGTQIDECYDNEKEFYVIHGLCIKKIPLELSQDKVKSKVFVDKLSNVSWHLIINNTDNIIDTLDSINNQVSKPSVVTVISYDTMPVTRLTKIIKRYNFKEWRVQVVNKGDRSSQVDVAIDKYGDIPIYITIESGQKLDSDLIDNVNDIIYNKLLTLGIYIEYPEKQTVITSTYIHKLLNGNAFDTPLKDKIKDKQWDKIIHNYLSLK
jgi:hypothetical protein